MKKIHEHLVGKHNWYANWHGNPHHSKAHWGILTLVAILLTSSLLTYSNTIANQVNIPPQAQQNKNILALNQKLLNLSARYIKANIKAKSTLATEITTLITERKVLLLDAAKNDPKTFLLVALPEKVKKTLPVEFGSLLEKDIFKEGKLNIEHFDFTDQKKSINIYTLTDNTTSKKYTLHFASNEPGLNLSGSTVRVSGKVLDQEIVIDGSTSSVTVLSSTSLVQASATAPIVHKTAVILVNFSDKTPQLTPDQIRTMMFTGSKSVQAYYTEQSFGQETFSGDVFGWYTIPYTSPGCTTSHYTLGEAAKTQAIAAGVDLSSYDTILYYIPNYCRYGGVATYGGAAYVFASYSYEYDTYVAIHELGHVIGLAHADSLLCATLQMGVYGDPDCVHYGYGNYFDSMGYGLYHFNAPHKIYKNWISSSNIQTVSTDGTYTIAPLETASTGVQVLKIYKANSPYGGEYIYVEYRQPYGFDATLPSTITNGVMINTDYGNVGIGRYTILRDSTPGDSNVNNAALSDGATFTDQTIGMVISQISHNATSATVRITFDPTVCIKVPPTLSVIPTSNTSTDGAPAMYTLSMTNTNNTNCTATTFQLAAQLPNTSWSASFSSPTVSLSPGETTTVTIYITPATGTVDGNYSFWLKATDTIDGTYTGRSQNLYLLVSTPPVVSITSPTNGSTIAGTTTISANATDNIGVDHVRFYRDSIFIGSDATTPYSMSWDTTQTTNGTYNISARAYDAAGNIGTSSTISVSVANNTNPLPSDTTAPVVIIKAPIQGATVASTVSISASATDNISVTKMELYIDNALITQNIQKTSITNKWNTRKYSNGPHTILVKAYDAAGNVGQSSVTVTK